MTFTLKRVLLICCLLMLQPLMAQDHYELTVDLRKVERQSIKVVMKPPADIGKFNSNYSFALPSSWGKHQIGIQHYLHGIRPNDANGKRIRHTFHDQNSIIIEEGDQLNELVYWVEDLIEKIPDKSRLPVAGVRLDERFLMLYPAFFAGYLNERTDLPYRIRIIHEPDMQSSFEPNTVESDTVDVFEFDHFFEMLGMPICYAAYEEHNFELQGKQIKLKLYDSSNKFKPTYFAQIVTPLIKESNAMLGEYAPDALQFAFLLDDQLKPDLKIPFGAQTRGNESFYWLPLKGKRGSLRMLVEDQVAHELMHALLPGALQDGKHSAHAFSAGDTNQHLWLMEGATEYFSLQLLAKAGSLSEKEMLRLWSSKVRHYMENPGASLLSIQGNTRKSRKSAHPNDLYSKGALLALCLDAELRNENSENSLLDVVLQLAKQRGQMEADGIPLADSLITSLGEIGGKKLAGALHFWLEENEALPIHSVLKSMGLTFHQEYFDTLYTYGRFRISPVTRQKKFIFSRVQENELGIEEGDALLSVNDVELQSDNYSRLLTKIREPERHEGVKLIVLRGDKQVELQGSPREDWERHMYVIRSDPKPKLAQLSQRLLMGFLLYDK